MNSRTARKDDRPHIRHGLRPMTPSPQGEGGSPLGLTDVGCIVFPGGPKIAPGPLHTRPLWATLCKQERAFLKAVKPPLLLAVHSPSLPYGQTAPSKRGPRDGA